MAKNVQDKSYNIAIQWDGRGYSEESDVPTFTPPSGLGASEDSGTITLTWTNGTPSASTIVERSNTGSGGWITITTVSAGTATYDDTPGSSGTYYYRVSHTLNGETTSVSSSANATISYVPPVSDGDEKTVTITGAGSNVPVSQFQFLGGSYGPIQNASDNALFDTFMPTGWAMPGSSGSRVSSEIQFNGKALKHDPTINGTTFGFSYNTGGIQRVGFAKYDVFFENVNNVATGQFKQVRFVGGTSIGNGIHDTQYANTYITRFASNYMPRNESGGLSTLYGGAPWYQPNEWVSIEARVTDCSGLGVADGSVRISVRDGATGALLGTFAQTGLVYRTVSEALIRQIVFQFYLGNGFGTSGFRVFIDRDVVCAWSTTTTPPKFIILGNASTYDACTIRTYCEWTNWDDNGATSDITFLVNQGRHVSLTGLYVYAMSDAGVPINTSGVALS